MKNKPSSILNKGCTKQFSDEDTQIAKSTQKLAEPH